MKKIKSVTVYLGSGGKVSDYYREQVSEFAKISVKNKVHIVYGGMRAGLMGVLADTVLEQKGSITGVIPSSIDDINVIHTKLQELDRTIVTDDMWERKKEMVHRGEGVIVFPGGYGTIDELFEFLYWGIKGYHKKPCLLVNINGYWAKVVDYINQAVEQGAMDASVKDIIILSDKVEDIYDDLKTWYKEHHDPNFDDTIFDEGNDFLSEIELDNLEPVSKPILITQLDMQDSYRFANALVLKQLNKMTRAIGVYDTSEIFNHLNDWIKVAAIEKFITPKCPDLVIFDDDKERLDDRLSRHVHVSTDLHEKWYDA